MDKFTTLTAVAAPLPLMNIDTDVIIPARALKTVTREGLGASAFYVLRYDETGAERPEFVLNQDRYRGSKILITGANFGCGSSREHAPWALAELGIRCVIAPSFADIFHTNCFKNGILCIALPQGQVDALAACAGAGNTAGGEFCIDLERECICTPDGGTVSFAVDPGLRDALIQGLDDIGATLGHADDIAAFEQRRDASQPWRAGALARMDMV